jgi:dienelactone hydrolase
MSVIGWSYGGGGVLAALKSVTMGSPITRAVMYYPVCRGAGSWTTGVIGLMLLGEKDDIAGPALCNVVANGVPPERLRVITYPTARHGFDMRGLPERPDLPPGSPGYNAEADKEAWSAVRDFLK